MPPTTDYVPVWSVRRKIIARPSATKGKSRQNSINGRSLPNADDDQDDDSDIDMHDAEYSRPVNSDFVHVTDPFYVAGVDPQQHLPQAPFPHADSSWKTARTELARGRAIDKPKVDTDNALQHRHLAVLTNILHTCLHRNDWSRAAKAWGLLLRTMHAGDYIDIRAHERWGIGAEILLRQGIIDTASQSRQDVPEYSAQAYEAAKAYLEQLIIQYPFNKQSPAQRIDALNFYPALIGLCIFQAVEANQAAIARLESDDFEAREEHASSSIELENIRKSELESALSIGERLDTVLVAPPYDKHVKLLQLRGMVGLWAADVCRELCKIAKTQESEVGDPSSASLEHDDIQDWVRQASDQTTKAIRHFEQLTALGHVLPDVIASYMKNHD